VKIWSVTLRPGRKPHWAIQLWFNYFAASFCQGIWQRKC